LRLSSFGGYGLALAALALKLFGAYDSYPNESVKNLLELGGLVLAGLQSMELAAGRSCTSSGFVASSLSFISFFRCGPSSFTESTKQTNIP